MIDGRRLSRARPAGHPSDWPIGDHQALLALLTAADLRREDHVVDRVTEAAAELGLDRRHWLVRDVLAFVFGKFPILEGRFYSEDAEAFFRSATPGDLHDREAVEWAKRLLRARPDD